MSALRKFPSKVLLRQDDIRKIVSPLVEEFYKRIIEGVRGFTLEDVLGRCNPLISKLTTATPRAFIHAAIVTRMVQSEITKFGYVLESIAREVAKRAHRGSVVKPDTPGLDLQMEEGSKIWLVSIKSSPNWGNSSAWKKLHEEFRKAQRGISQGRREERLTIHFICGSCTGKSGKGTREQNIKIMTGSVFWDWISGQQGFYETVMAGMEPVVERIAERSRAWDKREAELVDEFQRVYCDGDRIDWPKVLAAQSLRIKGRKV